MNRRISKLFVISVFNTVRMNYHYFGWGGVLRPRILASKNLKILKLDGTVFIKSTKIGAVQIGLCSIQKNKPMISKECASAGNN